MSEAWKGRNPVTAASPILADYLEMQRLAKLGITTDINAFDPEVIECFSMIASEIAYQEARERKKDEQKAKIKRGR